MRLPPVQVARLQPERRDDGARELLRVDHPVREHRTQHLVAALDRHRRMEKRVVDRRCLRQAGEECRLRQRQVLRARGEERLRGSLRSVRRPPVEHFVEIRIEDARLRPHLRELDREARFLHLAREGAARVADVEVADELLRDRRAALDDLPGGHVGIERAHDALVVEGAVLPEASVLDRDGRLAEVRRDLVQSERQPVHARRDDAEQRAVVGIHERVLSERDRLERAQVARAEQDGTTGGDGAGEHGPDRDEQDGDDEGRLVLGAHAAKARTTREQQRGELEVGTVAVPHCGSVCSRTGVRKPARRGRLREPGARA